MPHFSSLPEVLRHQASTRPDSVAVIVYSDRPGERPRLTFGELHAQASHLAQRLAAEAMPGDRALLIFPTCLEFVVSYFACLMAGIVAVPMMPPRRVKSCASLMVNNPFLRRDGGRLAAISRLPAST